MSKVGKFIKNNIIGFIIGTILFGGTGYIVATSIASVNVTYSGHGQTNVKGALDDLYGKADELNKLKYSITQSGYQYWKSSSTYSSTNAPATVYPNYASVVTANTTSTLIRTIYSNGNPTKHGVCLYYGYNNKIFCLDYGYWAANGASGDSVSAVLQSAIVSALGISSEAIGCVADSYSVFCSFGNNANCGAGSNGAVSCACETSSCTVSNDGKASC